MEIVLNEVSLFAVDRHATGTVRLGLWTFRQLARGVRHRVRLLETTLTEAQRRELVGLLATPANYSKRPQTASKMRRKTACEKVRKKLNEITTQL